MTEAVATAVRLLGKSVSGGGLPPEAQAFFKEADLVYAVSTSLGHTTTFWRPDSFAPKTKLIHIAQDRNDIGRVYPADVGIQADARTGRA